MSGRHEHFEDLFLPRTN